MRCPKLLKAVSLKPQSDTTQKLCLRIEIPNCLHLFQPGFKYVSVHVSLNGAWKCTITKNILECVVGGAIIWKYDLPYRLFLCVSNIHTKIVLSFDVRGNWSVQSSPRQGHTFHISPQQTTNGANALGTPKITPQNHFFTAFILYIFQKCTKSLQKCSSKVSDFH